MENSQLKTILQMFYSKCRTKSSELNENCNKMLTTRDSKCPECPEDIDCPESDPQAACKMHCFCK